MSSNDSDDLKMALAEQELLRLKLRRRSSMELILKAYAFAGALTAIFGAFYVTYILLDLNLSPEVQMGLLVAFSGTVMSIVSLFGLSYLRDRNKRLSIEQTDKIMRIALINEWAQFENIARSALKLNKKDSNYFSVRRLLESLRRDEKIDDRDFRALQTALELRNQIVHGVDEYSIEAAEVDYVSNLLRKIVSRLEESSSAKETEF
ncbi:hypothetical protein [uncultured Roseibium sp.]|uniref:hypothetical protein n=1 Tax=uncultured Roseibium sp. TaxID=1936171 RepID=UPI003216EF70